MTENKRLELIGDVMMSTAVLVTAIIMTGAVFDPGKERMFGLLVIIYAIKHLIVSSTRLVNKD